MPQVNSASRYRCDESDQKLSPLAMACRKGGLEMRPKTTLSLSQAMKLAPSIDTLRPKIALLRAKHGDEARRDALTEDVR